jgi:hypothetical protein
MVRVKPGAWISNGRREELEEFKGFEEFELRENQGREFFGPRDGRGATSLPD